tara:strand:+ start:214 stop:489 length:276 start_codon:yes stop_codon:yes gene_type:complete
MTLNGQETELNYKANMAELLLVPLNPEKGTTYAEMAVVMPLHAKFKGAGEFVDLEDAEHIELVKRLKNAKFIQNTPEIFVMIQSVVDAEAG